MFNARAAQERTVLFFTAGRTPTAAEIEMADSIMGKVQFRAPQVGSMKVAVNPTLPDGVAKAGATVVPAPYDDEEIEDISPNAGGSDSPQDLTIFPGNVTMASSAATPIQLTLAGVQLNDETGVLEVVNLTEHEDVEWSSATEADVTVSATGVVTAVSSGASVITATFTDADDNELTATCTVTVTA